MEQIYLHLWAKTGSSAEEWHPLIFHMLDAAQVAIVLWKKTFSRSLQERFNSWLGCSSEDTAQTLSFWVALHDLGKVSPAFQRKSIPLQKKLISLGLDFPELCSPQWHGLVTGWALESLLPASGLSMKDARQLARALAGHHGIWPASAQIIDPSKTENLGGELWQSARKNIFDLFQTFLKPSTSLHLPQDSADRNAFLTLFSGFVTTADWISSMENFFPYTCWETPFGQYLPQSAKQANTAIHQLGFDGWQADGSTIDFQKTFNFPPNEIQQNILEKACQVSQPAMLIVEAPTGCGKTELAFSVADSWLQRSLGRGIYIAMPTTATSNSMFNRTKEDYLSQRYPGDQINFQLAHGSALLQDNFQSMIIQSVGEDENLTDGSITAMEWFLPRKRTLLAPFAVGTVDQVLLSVLNTRHFFVRLFGLGGKVVIFDEVHAYDVYMQVLFCRLLEWLSAAGVSVIILSATLPASTRRQLVQAYTGLPCPTLASAYPGFTLASAQSIQSNPLPLQPSKGIHLTWIEPDADSVVAALKEKLDQGGCAAVICNTVRRAQEIYRAVRDAQICPPEFCWLFHARVPFDARQAMEKKVVEAFGKNPPAHRPTCAILVATQVVEQSLDLDFDLMISDLAPIDLTIQRAGRLHRHDHPDRPAGLQSPHLILCRPTGEDPDAPDFGGSRYVYEPYYLLRSLAILQGKTTLSLPEETQALIESVYSETDFPGLSPYQSELADARKKLEKDQTNSSREAKARLILPPNDPCLLNMKSDSLEEDDPTIHRSLQALTRLGNPSVQLICLHRLKNGELNTQADGGGATIRLDQPPDHDTQQALLRTGISVQHYGVVSFFQNQSVPSTWKKIAALRYCHCIEFKEGTCHPEGAPFRLVLDPEMGLWIEKEV